MRIKRLDLIKDDPAKVMDVLEKGTLGNKLGLLRAMGMAMSCERRYRSRYLRRCSHGTGESTTENILDDWLFQSIRI